VIPKRMDFEHEDMLKKCRENDNSDAEAEEELKKRSITFGFSTMLDSIIGQDSSRSHTGYSKLEPEQPRNRRDRVRYKFSNKKYFNYYIQLKKVSKIKKLKFCSAKYSQNLKKLTF
jgi:hypothetical protein